MRTLKTDFNTKNLAEKTQFIKDVSDKYTDFEFDMTALNLIDAAKTALLLSTKLFCENSRAKIRCILKDKDTLNVLSSQKLKNTFLSVNLNEDIKQHNKKHYVQTLRLNRKYAK